jgi:hypothetical protein
MRNACAAGDAAASTAASKSQSARRLRDQTEWDEAFMASIVVGHGKN